MWFGTEVPGSSECWEPHWGAEGRGPGDGFLLTEEGLGPAGWVLRERREVSTRTDGHRVAAAHADLLCTQVPPRTGRFSSGVAGPAHHSRFGQAPTAYKSLSNTTSLSLTQKIKVVKSTFRLIFPHADHNYFIFLDSPHFLSAPGSPPAMLSCCGSDAGASAQSPQL